MSEIANTLVRFSKSRIIVIVLAALTILLLLLSYGAGVIVLPTLVLTNYQSKDCGSALSLNKLYTSLYPKFIEDGSLLAPVQECEAYTSAVAKEELGNWNEAFDAYQAYASRYPNGLYTTEAHQQSGAALFHLSQEQIKQEKYEDALANLNLIIASHSDTFIITDAWNLYPSVYMPWGVSLREADDFERSEQVLNEFKTWGSTNQKSDWVTAAQRELAETYFVWGLDLQSQAQFEDAIAKLDLAAAADPESQSASAAKVKAGLSSIYVDWGNDLLKQNQFPMAIEKLALAVAKSEGIDDGSAKDALANGQIQWAQSLRAQDDFQGALAHLQSAKEVTDSVTMQESVETALQDTYLAFSKSTGSQARHAMKDAVEALCKKHKTPQLPIFGLNKDSIRLGLYGAEESLPVDLAAKTPGELHYVACITTDNQTVETRIHKNIVFHFSRVSFYELVEQFRVQVIWNVDLFKLDTGKLVGDETFKGDPPPPFAENAGNYFYGATPVEEFTQWLESLIQ